MPVTCDVNPLVLLLTPEDFTAGAKVPLAMSVGSYDDVAALWENLHIVDCFSAGPEGDASMVTAALLTLVNEGRLSLEDVVAKMHDNPKRILHLPTQPETFVEIDLDKTWRLPESSPLGGRTVSGRVRRVVLRGHTVYVDGKLCTEGEGVDVLPSSAAQSAFTPQAGFPSALMAGEPAHEAHHEQQYHHMVPMASPHVGATKLPMFGTTPMIGAIPQSTTPVTTLLPTTPHVTAVQTHKDAAAPRHVVSIKQFDRNRLH